MRFLLLSGIHSIFTSTLCLPMYTAWTVTEQKGMRKAMGTSNSPLGSRLPKQIQRALPIYIILVLLILFASNSDRFRHSTKPSNAVKRAIVHKPTASVGEYIPKKIWQTWKVDALSFEERDLTTARTWTAKNPGHRYESLTDNNDMYYVETHFGPSGLNRPDIVETYRALTAKIIKADLIRYLVMYAEGGVYTDIDVEALKPLDRFVPERYDQSDINMVIGIEIDQPDFRDHAILGKKCMSFCQWTFMCKPGLPVMLRLIENIMSWLDELSKQKGVPIGELQLDFDEVISGTGPSAFTAAVLAEMSISTGHKVEWDEFHNMAESKLVGGVLVLTVEAFAAGQGHSDSGNHNARTALVKHHYHASGWPSTHPRYAHPVYGEVEKCNWESECVKLWDFNKAAFDTLSPEDQAKQIAYKEAADMQAAKQAEDLKNLKAIQEANLEKYVAAEKAALAEQAAKAIQANLGGGDLSGLQPVPDQQIMKAAPADIGGFPNPGTPPSTEQQPIKDEQAPLEDASKRDTTPPPPPPPPTPEQQPMNAIPAGQEEKGQANLDSKPPEEQQQSKGGPGEKMKLDSDSAPPPQPREEEQNKKSAPQGGDHPDLGLRSPAGRKRTLEDAQ